MLSNCNDLVLAKCSYYPLRCITSYFLDQTRSAVLELKKKNDKPLGAYHTGRKYQHNLSSINY